MAELFVTDEQARVISAAAKLIPIRDSRGNVIGHAVGLTVQSKPSRLSSEQVAEAEKRLDTDGPWYTTSEVMEHMREMEST